MILIVQLLILWTCCRYVNVALNGRITEDELEIVGNEAAFIRLSYHCQLCMGMLRKTLKSSVGTL